MPAVIWLALRSIGSCQIFEIKFVFVYIDIFFVGCTIIIKIYLDEMVILNFIDKQGIGGVHRYLLFL